MSSSSSTGSLNGPFGSAGAFQYDDHNALGGGAGMFDFGMHFHQPGGSPLPQPPGAYEEFNPFSAKSPIDYSALLSPGNTLAANMPSPAGAPEPLLDNSDQSLFSSFLNTFSVDQNFLFNPVLPDGMPSPPPALESPQWKEEREQLANRLDRVVTSPGHHGSNDGTVKPERSSPELFEDDDEEQEELGDGDYTEDGPGSVESASKRNGRRQNEVRKKMKIDPDDEDYELPSNRAPSSSRRRQSGRGTRPTRIQQPQSPESANGATNDDSYYDTTPSGSGSGRNRASVSVGPSASGSAAMSESQKRSNHIASEQKRREIIKVGFKDLVDLITAGSNVSGISIMPNAEPGKKGKGRGRGRKGDPSGASKATVLEKAREYLLWLEQGNEALEAEIKRVEPFHRS